MRYSKHSKNIKQWQKSKPVAKLRTEWSGRDRTLAEMSRAMLDYVKLGEHFWSQAVKTPAYNSNKNSGKQNAA